MASSSPGTRGAEQGTAAADMNIRKGVMTEYKHESRRPSHDASRENVAFCNGHTRKDRSPEAANYQQAFSNGIACHAAEDGSRRASVVCYRDGEECVLRKGICYSENCAGVTDENLNESSAARLKPDDDCPTRRKRSFAASSEESLLSIFKQAAVPFFLGGLGTVFAGLILDTVQFWPPFEHVTELFIVVPPLLGLKGNLEMTLAARLSTQANLGNMDTPRKVWDIAVGNMALVQSVA
ncbi:solute carrier family 41 member 1-like [Rhipicephalus sanguineus]|uniref:solute carrier family 41 member 1-like n=1 Tax=Rhipicephalus sanguineus TaxID=34632 RepID=UPI0020C451A2|nr:solute carrier family 41 member 1-like [Rhipicephalus sanguineus]